MSVSSYRFWNWGTYAIFDMEIVSLDAGSYLCQTSVKALATADKEKKDKNLQSGLDCRRSFTPVVYSTYGITGTEAVVTQKCLTSMISNKINQ